MPYATVTSYFAELDTISEITEKTQNVINHRLPSTGRFIFSLSVDKFFGIPRSVSAKGLEMDMDRVFHYSLEKNGDKEKTKQFNLTVGMNSSALEHSVPEQLFSTTTNPAQAVSAVKALAIANSQGIPIYQINQANIASILPNLQLDGDTIADIQNAVNAGKEVTVSQREIDFKGRMVAGYLIIDPETGAGAYMISGGNNGAYAIAQQIILHLIWAIVIFFSLASTITLTAGPGLILAAILTVVGTILSRLTNWALGFRNDSLLQTMINQGTNLISAIILGTGLAAIMVGVATMGLPAAVAILGSSIFIGTTILLDYVINFLTFYMLDREMIISVCRKRRNVYA